MQRRLAWKASTIAVAALAAAFWLAHVISGSARAASTDSVQTQSSVSTDAQQPSTSAVSTPSTSQVTVADSLMRLHNIISDATNQGTFAGHVDNPQTGQVTAYVTPAGYAALHAALSGQGAISSVTIKQVPRSYESLAALTRRITSDQSAIASAGIDMQEWGPDVPSNSVGMQVRSNAADAQAYMDKTYGAGLVTVTHVSIPAEADSRNRYYDVPPYRVGDRIWMPSECTDSYFFIGNNSGNVYGLTAGHCGGSEVKTNDDTNATIGKVSTDYYTSVIDKHGNHTWDAESFHCAGGLSQCDGGKVWSGGTNYHYVTQLCGSACGIGDLVAADGATTGEVTDNKVAAQDICIKWASGSQAGQTDCNLYAATNGGTWPSRPGDSGGPVYQRKGTSNDVWATGVIAGSGPYDGYYSVYYLSAGQLLSYVNGTLVTSPTS